MSEMVERMAKALLEVGCDEPNLDDYRDMARAAIEAMREPTAVMIAAGDEVIPDNATYEDNAANAYRSMIDAALKD